MPSRPWRRCPPEARALDEGAAELLTLAHLLSPALWFPLVVLTAVSSVFALAAGPEPTWRGRRERICFHPRSKLKLLRVSTYIRFSRMLAGMLGAGLSLPRSLSLLQQSEAGGVLEKAIRKMETDLANGLPLSESVEQTRLLEPSLRQVLQVGEQTGERRNWTPFVAGPWVIPGRA